MGSNNDHFSLRSFPNPTINHPPRAEAPRDQAQAAKMKNRGNNSDVLLLIGNSQNAMSITLALFSITLQVIISKTKDTTTFSTRYKSHSAPYSSNGPSLPAWLVSR